ncbi:MAG: carbamoyltransferase [Acidobacteriia bacterium]|nr:carbamoyltransferase [Terriglobia bacterium]
MLILGLSSFKHDTAAALLDNGAIKAAIENDKLVRSRTVGLPENAIRFCLDKAGVRWDDLDAIAVATRPFRGWTRRSLLRARLSPFSPVAAAYHEANELGVIAREVQQVRTLHRESGSSNILHFEHHLCHAANAFHLSPYDRALILTLDREGDGHSGMVAVGEGTRIRVLRTIPFPHSLAWIYAQVTDLLGFLPHHDEHKTQWLSLEGEPVFKNVFIDMLRNPKNHLPRLNYSYVNRGLAGRLTFSAKFYQSVGISDRKADLSDDQRRALASSLQVAITEVIGSLLAYFRDRTGIDNVCLGGGLFQNTLLVANLEKRLGLNQVFVPPAPGNSGNAVGAATLAWHQTARHPRTSTSPHAYWGPACSRSEIKDVLDNCKARYSLQTTEERKLDAALQLLESGKIVGWFQGAAEFGPRALGNRSLLASPWAPYVRENLNDFIKHREWFRPFAVSVPEEDCERYFECSQLCQSMNSLATARHANVLPKGFLLPGNLVRLHVVRQQSNPLFWRLLKRFGEQAPAPMLVNTSFNLFGEPLVVKPRDAMRSYFCSGIDALVVDNFVLSKAATNHVLAATRAS